MRRPASTIATMKERARCAVRPLAVVEVPAPPYVGIGRSLTNLPLTVVVRPSHCWDTAVAQPRVSFTRIFTQTTTVADHRLIGPQQ
jgi:hypothetical protein